MGIKKKSEGYRNYVDKPWGYELIVEKIHSVNPKVKGTTIHKILVVLANQEISYQYHKYRYETWCIKHGDCEISINGITYVKVFPGTIWKIEPGTKHSIKAITPTVIDEWSQDYIEDDIIRLSDNYGRV